MNWNYDKTENTGKSDYIVKKREEERWSHHHLNYSAGEATWRRLQEPFNSRDYTAEERSYMDKTCDVILDIQSSKAIRWL